MNFDKLKSMMTLMLVLFASIVSAQRVSDSTASEISLKLQQNNESFGQSGMGLYGVGYGVRLAPGFDNLSSDEFDQSEPFKVNFTFSDFSSSGLGSGQQNSSGPYKKGILPCMLQAVPSLDCFVKEKQVTSQDQAAFNGKTSDTTTFIDCEKPEAGTLGHLQEVVDWGQCFRDRLSYTRDSVNEKILLQKDQDICNCLRSSKHQGVVFEMGQNHGVKAEEKSRQVPQEELNKVLTPILFQTLTLTGSPDLAAKWAHNLYDSTTVAGQKLDFRPANDFFIDKVPYPAGQCFSPRHFFQFRQLPGEKVRKAMSGKKFSDNDWNYKKLQSAYQELMSKSLAIRTEKKEELETLKAKLKFLNRNPLIKYSLGSDDNTQAFGQVKLKVLEAFNLLMKEECRDPGSECSKDYTNLMNGVFHSEGVMTAIRQEARVDHQARIEARRKKDLLTTRGDVSQKNVIHQFMSSYGMSSPDSCEPGITDDKKAEECLKIHSGYCKILDNYKDQIEAMSYEQVDPDILDDLDVEIANEFNTDIASNDKFKKFNERHCGISRMSNDGKKQANFEQFVKEYCANPGQAGCTKASADDYMELRKRWVSNYPEEQSQKQTDPQYRIAPGSVDLDKLVRQFDKSGTQNNYVKEAKKTEVVRLQDDMKKQQTDKQLQRSVIATAKELSRSGFAMGWMGNMKSQSEDRPFLADFGQALANTMGTTPLQNSGYNYDDIGTDYNFAAPATTGTQAVAEIPKVENMSEEGRQEMLNDWQSEYESWRKEKGTELSAADAAKDNALRQEIATLRALLAQQKELSAQQFKMLNDAIAAKSGDSSSLSGTSRTEERPDTRKAAQTLTAGGSRSIAGAAEETEAVRNPGNVKDPKINMAASGGSSSVTSAKRNKNADSSADSVAREEAKLVNMRKYADGSITIESVGPSAAASAGNAISVPVSDEQYRMLQSNPAGLNLGQIERSIPKDQIARLEQNGEIIILLRNGSNPPFEVKVEKKDNRLVYKLKDSNGKDQGPVRRVYTREALELQLKVQR